MSVIAIVNRKGGSGKSTLATHVAGYLASLGYSVMLGDVDRQQSSRYWLGLRAAERTPIRGWTIDERNFARPPAGTQHVVLDTPGGFHGVGLMKVSLYADAVLLPATNSVFDRIAAEESLAELRTQPRIAGGKCRIACLGMRIDARTRNAAALAEWAAAHAVDYLGTIRATQTYCRLLEQGLSLFDFAPERVTAYRPDWDGVTRWLDSVLHGEIAAPRLVRPVDALHEAAEPGSVPGFLRRDAPAGGPLQG
ncbi:ParA family protein [Niveibacterium umoris]|uniref:Chromosome partitioning protein n=1 Tax=Niveibacterium umoris TaxID=1193620 RepID=A0A840BQI1_9RHOO|nr:ParA family protein [Niveibacterium umoris]MBB4013788.1 chromosome partitioning protein [Niveibacterium umoris]